MSSLLINIIVEQPNQYIKSVADTSQDTSTDPVVLGNMAIEYLLRVMEFFQSKKLFKFKNAPMASVDPSLVERQGEIEICIELDTLSFEQLNDLWGFSW